jgi:hypothetical protein
MTKAVCALVILAGLSGPAWSQTLGESVSTGSARYSGQLLNHEIRVDEPDRGRCLVRKKTGRTECRSLAGWRRLARKMDEARESGQERR